MEASTFWKVTLLLVAVGGGLSGIQYYRNFEHARMEAHDLKLQLSDMLAIRDSRQRDWSAYEAQKNRATQASGKTTLLEKQKEELEKKIRASEGEFKYLVKATRDAVTKVRTDASGTVIPELKLADGRVLKDAKIRKIESSQISFTHSDGIGLVPFNQLPPDLMEQLDVGGSSIMDGVATTENDIFTGITRAAGLTLKCPISLTEMPYSMNSPAIAEVKRFEGKNADEMEVSVICFRYVKGTEISLDAAAAGSMKALSALEGMANPQQQVQDVKISSFPGKRISFSARRFGGEVSAETLVIYNGEKMWVVQVVYTNKSKGAAPVVESIFKSVEIEPAA